jgi:hypothetical protein
VGEDMRISVCKGPLCIGVKEKAIEQDSSFHLTVGAFGFTWFFGRVASRTYV